MRVITFVHPYIFSNKPIGGIYGHVWEMCMFPSAGYNEHVPVSGRHGYVQDGGDIRLTC